MRIIAGRAKGRRLKAPAKGTRPFTGRAKEAVFSALGERIPGARVLDLFAGTGSLGLEALSRGAGSATFVENGGTAVAILRENIATVGLGGRIVHSDAVAFLRRDRASYDVIFADPPYADSDEGVLLMLRLAADRLEPGGVVVLHRRAGGSEPASDNLHRTDRRRYGDSEIWTFKKEEA
jgi:16S rRNA (guanine966-N2)-methyltransferase